MGTLVHADIFFFISTISLCVGIIVFLILAWYVLQILRDVHEISMKAKDAAGKLESDFEALRKDMQDKGKKISSIADMILGFISRFVSPKRKKKE